MKYKYKRIEVKTIKGLDKVENLCLIHGWEIYDTTIFDVYHLRKPIISNDLLKANKLL